MDRWTEIRTAAHVARLGTVSAAAEALGVHRATVNRHIDALEAALGAKLFHRHKKGFTPTELGRELSRVAGTADEHFEEFYRKALGHTEELHGDFIVTSLEALAPRLLPVLKTMGERYPGLVIHYLASDSLLRLEYGEAHVAFRAGARPQDPDNVVRAFDQQQVGLYASVGYAARYGVPKGPEEFEHHRFVGSNSDTPRAPFLDWLARNVPDKCIILRSNAMSVLRNAVQNGTGIGFLPRGLAHDAGDLVEVTPPRPEWSTNIWMVTHVDLHRSAKVQAFLVQLQNHQQSAENIQPA